MFGRDFTEFTEEKKGSNVTTNSFGYKTEQKRQDEKHTHLNGILSMFRRYELVVPYLDVF